MARLVLYDGECGLCDRSVRFIYARDPEGAFRFAPLQSPLGQRKLREHALPTDRLDTMVLLDEDGAWTRSTAALRIARRLRGPVRALGAFLALPRWARDWAYDAVARRRHRWRKDDACAPPPPGLRARIVEE